jgi:hypothetical protein
MDKRKEFSIERLQWIRVYTKLLFVIDEVTEICGVSFSLAPQFFTLFQPLASDKVPGF